MSSLRLSSTFTPHPGVLVVAPFAMVFARFGLAVLFQALTAGGLWLQGATHPWQAAAPWWTVYGSLIDGVCLVALVWLLRAEGMTLRSVVDFQRRRIGRDLLLALALLALFLVLGFGGGALAGALLYGGPPPTPMGGLPRWAALYSVVIWPLLWAFTEQLVYLGYALPRVRDALGSASLAIGVVALGWALQHTALPLLPDARFILYRFLATLPFAIVIPIFLRVRRLPAFMAAHWAIDALAAAITVWS